MCVVLRFVHHFASGASSSYQSISVDIDNDIGVHHSLKISANRIEYYYSE